MTPTWYELALLILGAVLITAAVGWMAVAWFISSRLVRRRGND